MIIETGRVVGIEPDGLWVETIQTSTCSSCTAQKGCGHGLLNQFRPGRSHQIRIGLPSGLSADQIAINDEVELSLAESTLVKGALLVYLVPLISMLAAVVAASLFSLGDGWSVAVAALGFGLGLIVVWGHGRASRGTASWQPQLVTLRRGALLLMGGKRHSV